MQIGNIHRQVTRLKIEKQVTLDCTTAPRQRRCSSCAGNGRSRTQMQDRTRQDTPLTQSGFHAPYSLVYGSIAAEVDTALPPKIALSFSTPLFALSLISRTWKCSSYRHHTQAELRSSPVSDRGRTGPSFNWIVALTRCAEPASRQLR